MANKKATRNKAPLLEALPKLISKMISSLTPLRSLGLKAKQTIKFSAYKPQALTISYSRLYDGIDNRDRLRAFLTTRARVQGARFSSTSGILKDSMLGYYRAYAVLLLTAFLFACPAPGGGGGGGGTAPQANIFSHNSYTFGATLSADGLLTPSRPGEVVGRVTINDLAIRAQIAQRVQSLDGNPVTAADILASLIAPAAFEILPQTGDLGEQDPAALFFQIDPTSGEITVDSEDAPGIDWTYGQVADLLNNGGLTVRVTTSFDSTALAAQGLELLEGADTDITGEIFVAINPRPTGEPNPINTITYNPLQLRSGGSEAIPGTTETITTPITITGASLSGMVAAGVNLTDPNSSDGTADQFPVFDTLLAESNNFANGTEPSPAPTGGSYVPGLGYDMTDLIEGTGDTAALATELRVTLNNDDDLTLTLAAGTLISTLNSANSTAGSFVNLIANSDNAEISALVNQDSGTLIAELDWEIEYDYTRNYVEVEVMPGMPAELPTYRFTLNNSAVEENNVINQVLQFPRLNQAPDRNARAEISNPQEAYGLPRDADGYTLFYELRDSSDLTAACANGAIYFDNGDFRIRAGDILDFEAMPNQFSCRFAVSITGSNSDFRFIGLALPNGGTAEDFAMRMVDQAAEQVMSTDIADITLALDANNGTSTANDCLAEADGGTDAVSCYFASVEVEVSNVEEAPAIALSDGMGNTIVNPAQRDFGDVTEGLLALPAYQASAPASVPSLAQLAAMPDQATLTTSSLLLSLQDDDDNSAPDATTIRVTNIDPNHDLAPTHPLFSVSDNNRTIGDILDRLFTLTPVANAPANATLSVNRQFLDYETFPQDRIENDSATYTITFRADDETNPELSAAPVRATFNLADVRFAPVFVDTSESVAAAPSVNVPEPVGMASALIPEAGVNLNRTTSVLTLLPGFRALLQSRLGTVSAVNPETGAGYDNIAYTLQPLFQDASLLGGLGVTRENIPTVITVLNTIRANPAFATTLLSNPTTLTNLASALGLSAADVPAAITALAGLPELIRMNDTQRESTISAAAAALSSTSLTLSDPDGNPIVVSDSLIESTIQAVFQDFVISATNIAPNLAMIPAQVGTPAVNSGRLIVAGPALRNTNNDLAVALIASLEPNNPASPLVAVQGLNINVAENAVEGTAPDLDMDVNNFAPDIEITNGVVIATAPETPGNTLTGANGNATFVDLTSQPLNLLRAFNASEDNLYDVLGVQLTDNGEQPNVTFSILPASFASLLAGGGDIGLPFDPNLIADIQTLGIDLAAEQDVFFMRNETTGILGINANQQIDFNRVYNLLIVINPSNSESPRVFNTAGGSNLALVNVYPTDVAEPPTISPDDIEIMEPENQAFSRSFTITDDQDLSGISISLNASDGSFPASDDLMNAITATRDGNTITLATEGLDFEDATLRQEIEDFTLRIADQGVFSWFGGPTGIRTAPALASAAASMSASAAINITLTDDPDEGIEFTLTSNQETQTIMEDLATGMSVEVAILRITSDFPGVANQDTVSRNISLSFANDANSQFFNDALRPVFGDPSGTDPIEVPVSLEVIDEAALGRLGDGITVPDVTIVANEILSSRSVRTANTADASFGIRIDDAPSRILPRDTADSLEEVIRSMDNVNSALGTIGEDASFAVGSVLSSPTNMAFAQIPFSALATETDEFYRFPGGIALRRATPQLSLGRSFNANEVELAITPDLANEQVITLVAPDEADLNDPDVVDPVYTLQLLNSGFIEASLFGDIMLNLNVTLDGDALNDLGTQVTLNVEEPNVKSVEFENRARDARTEAVDTNTLSPRNPNPFDEIYQVTYTQTALADEVVPPAGDDPTFSQFQMATNISDDDNNDDTSETLDIRSSDNNFVRLREQDQVFSTVTIGSSRYIARNPDDLATNDFDGREIVNPSNTGVSINLDILDANINGFDLTEDNANLVFEILTQDEETGDLVSAAGEDLSEDPALNFRAYWQQPTLSLVRDANGDPMMDADGNLMPQINIAQRTYPATATAPDGTESESTYNALDTLQLYDGTTSAEANLQYFIRVGTDANFNNASNYAMAQFNVEVTPASVGQGTEVLGVALLPTSIPFDPTLVVDLDADPLADDDALDATRAAIQAALNSNTTDDGRNATFSNGDFILDSIAQNGDGITLEPNSFDQLDLVVVLGNADGSGMEGVSTITADLSGGTPPGMAEGDTRALGGQLIALRPAGGTGAPEANQNAVAQSANFTETPDTPAIYVLRFDFAIAQNYEGDANFPLIIQETLIENEVEVPGERNLVDIEIEVTDIPATEDIPQIFLETSGISFVDGVGQTALQPGAPASDAVVTEINEPATQRDIHFDYTSLPANPLQGTIGLPLNNIPDPDIGALGRTATTQVTFSAAPQNTDVDNPGVGTAENVDELFVRGGGNSDTLIYKNNAWGSDTITHRVTYTEPRGFDTMNTVTYTREYNHFFNVINVNDPTTLLAFNDFGASTLTGTNFLDSTGDFTGTSLSGTGSVTVQDPDFAYDNNRARVLGGMNGAPDVDFEAGRSFTQSPVDRTGLALTFTMPPTVAQSDAVAENNQTSVAFAYSLGAAAGSGNELETNARQANPGTYDLTFTFGGDSLAVGSIDFTDIPNDAELTSTIGPSVTRAQNVPSDTLVETFVLTDFDFAKEPAFTGSLVFEIADVSLVGPNPNNNRMPAPVRFNINGPTVAGTTITHTIVTDGLLSGLNEGDHMITYVIRDTRNATDRPITGNFILRVTPMDELITFDSQSLTVIPSGTPLPAGTDNSGSIRINNQRANTTFVASLSYTDVDFADPSPPEHVRVAFTGLVVTFRNASAPATNYECFLNDIQGTIEGVGLGGDAVGNIQTITNASIRRGLTDSTAAANSPSNALTFGDIVNLHANGRSSPRCDDPELGDSIVGFQFDGFTVVQNIQGLIQEVTRTDQATNANIATVADAVAANAVSGFRRETPDITAAAVDGLRVDDPAATARVVIAITDNDPDDGSPLFSNTNPSGNNGDLIDRDFSQAGQSAGSDWINTDINVEIDTTSPGALCDLPGLTAVSTTIGSTGRNQVFPGSGSTLSFNVPYSLNNDALLAAQSWTCTFALSGLEDGGTASINVTFNTNELPRSRFSIERGRVAREYDFTGGNVPNIIRPSFTSGLSLNEDTNLDAGNVLGNFTISDDDITRGILDSDGNETTDGAPLGTHTFSFTSNPRNLVSFRTFRFPSSVLDGNGFDFTGPMELANDANRLINGTVLRSGLRSGLGSSLSFARQALFNLNRSLTPQDIGTHTVRWQITDDRIPTPSGTQTETGSFTLSINRLDDRDIQGVTIERIQAVDAGGTANNLNLLSNGRVSGGAENLQATISYRDSDFLENINLADDTVIERSIAHNGFTFNEIIFTFQETNDPTQQFTCRIIDNALAIPVASSMEEYGRGPAAITSMPADSVNVTGPIMIGNRALTYTDIQGATGCGNIEIGSAIISAEIRNLVAQQAFDTRASGNTAGLTFVQPSTAVPSVSGSFAADAQLRVSGFRVEDPTVSSAGDVSGLVINTLGSTALVTLDIMDNDPDDGSPGQPNATLAGDRDVVVRPSTGNLPWDTTPISVTRDPAAVCDLPGFPTSGGAAGIGSPTLVGDPNTANGTLSFSVDYEITTANLNAGQSWTCTFMLSALEDSGTARGVVVTFSTDAQAADDFTIIRQPSDDFTGANINRIGIDGEIIQDNPAFARLTENTIRDDDAVIGNFTITDDDFAAGLLNESGMALPDPDISPVGTHIFSFTSGARGLVSFDDEFTLTGGGLRGVRHSPSTSSDGNTVINGSLIAERGGTHAGSTGFGRLARQALFNLRRDLTPRDIGRHTVNWQITDDLASRGTQTETGSLTISINRVDNTSIEDLTIEGVQAVDASGNTERFLSNGRGDGEGVNLQATISYRDSDFLESFNFDGTETRGLVDHSSFGFSSITFTFEIDSFGFPAQFNCEVDGNLQINNFSGGSATAVYGRSDNNPDTPDDLVNVTGTIVLDGSPLSYTDITASTSDSRCADLPIGAGIVRTSIAGLVVSQELSSIVAPTPQRTAIGGLTLAASTSAQDVTGSLLAGDLVQVNISGFRVEEVGGTIANGGAHTVLSSSSTTVDLEVSDPAQPILLRVTLTDGDIDDGYPALPGGAMPTAVNRGSSAPWPAVGSQAGIDVRLTAVSGNTCGLASANPTITGDTRSFFGIDLIISIPATSLTAQDDPGTPGINEGLASSGNCQITLSGLEDGVSNNQTFFSYRRNPLVVDADGDGVNDITDRDANGNGLIDISNADQLANISMDLDGNGRLDSANSFGAFIPGCAPIGNAQPACNGYELMNDIDLRGVNWIPLGDDPIASNGGADAFSGTFEGNGYRINDMLIIVNASLPQKAADATSVARNNIGFFAVIDDATIRNVHLINASILMPSGGGLTTSERVGGLVGRVVGSSLISSSSVFADRIEGTNSIGGLVGRMSNGRADVRESAAFAISIGGPSARVVGGLIASNNPVFTGGVSAGVSNFTNNYVITRTLTAGGSTGTIRVGGLLGNAQRSSVFSSYAVTELLAARVTNNLNPIFGEIRSTGANQNFLDANAQLFWNVGLTRFVELPDGAPQTIAPNSDIATRQPTDVMALTTTQFTTAPRFFTNYDSLTSLQQAPLSVICSPDSRAAATSATSVAVWRQGTSSDNRRPNINCWTGAGDGELRGVSVDRQRDAIRDYLDTAVDIETIINNLRGR